MLVATCVDSTIGGDSGQVRGTDGTLVRPRRSSRRLDVFLQGGRLGKRRVFGSRFDLPRKDKGPRLRRGGQEVPGTGGEGRSVAAPPAGESKAPAGPPGGAAWEVFSPSLSRSAAASLGVDNAGGNSVRSEALSMHIFERGLGASDFVFEMQVAYDVYGMNIVDYLCTCGANRVGVSVFRGMGYPTAASFTAEDARRLVLKKLSGLVVARNCVARRHRFQQCVLHCIAQTPRIGMLVEQALREYKQQEGFEPELAALVTVVPRFPDVFYEGASAQHVRRRQLQQLRRATAKAGA